MDKENEKLNVISVHAETGPPGGRKVSSKIVETMELFGDFLGAKKVVYHLAFHQLGGMRFTENRERFMDRE